MIMFNIVLTPPIGEKWMARYFAQNGVLDVVDGLERAPRVRPIVDNSSPAVDK
jgi:hypothetical protein